MVAERGGHHVILDRFEAGRGDIAAKAGDQLRAESREEMRHAGHHAAAHHDAARDAGEHQNVRQLRQRVRDAVPDRIILGELLRRPALPVP